MAAGLLQRHGVAEQGLLVIGKEAEILFERLEGFARATVMDKGDAKPKERIRAGGIGRRGVAERVGGLAPAFQIAVADTDVEVGGAVLRLGFGELRVGSRGGLVVAHFVLNMAQGGVEAGFALPVLECLVQQAGGALQLAFQVQPHCLGERFAGTLLVFEIGNRSDSRRHGQPVGLIRC
jgi:hypothetical protein